MIRTIFTFGVAILLLSGDTSAQPISYPSTNPRAIPGPRVPAAGIGPRTASLEKLPQIPNVYPQTNAAAPSAIGFVRSPTTAVSAAPRIKGQLCELAQIVAVVGGESILAGDLEAEMLQIRERISENVTDEQFDLQRPALMKDILKKRVDTMIVYQDFLRQIPKERHGDLISNIGQQFHEKQVALTLKQNKVNTIGELDTLLRSRGSSLQRLKRDFTEQVIAQQMVHQRVDAKKEITHEEMLEYYQQRIADYEFPAKARWEELVVEFLHYRNEQAARREIAELGNEVLRGAPLNAVAKRSGQGPRHEQGGQYDWTTQGSLRSDSLDEVIFSLPMGKLSQIIRDDDGLHIIRVIERTEAGRESFKVAQVEIKKQISDERRKKRLDEYIGDLRAQTPVWTIFDEGKRRR